MSASWSRKFPRLVAETAAAPDDTNGSRVDRGNAQGEVSPYLAGEVIGDRYRLVRELGRGGMGVVWVGYALALGVEVAVKLIRASVAGPAVATRMAREANAAARLGHPALVRVFDFGWTNRGDPYLVMELVQGETLSACLEREGRISAIRAVQMLLPVADGLRLAHDRTIVHRDIKPDNIFIATDPLGRTQPKLLDFGIAKVGPGTIDAKLTQVGVVLGSPEYMSPEQALGIEDVDERTDVWSLSVVLYEMVTGTTPFMKANYNALMQAIIHEPATPMMNLAEGDDSLWRVVERGLAKDRETRWATMAELGEALALWLYEHGIKEDICGNSIRAVWLDGAGSIGRVRNDSSVLPSPHAASGITRQATTAATALDKQRRAATIIAARHLSSGHKVGVALASGILLGGGIIAAMLLPRAQSTTPIGASEASLTAIQQQPENSASATAMPPVSASIPGQSDTTVPATKALAVPSSEPTVSKSTVPPAGAGSGGRVRSSNSSSGPARANVKGSKRHHDFGF